MSLFVGCLTLFSTTKKVFTKYKESPRINFVLVWLWCECFRVCCLVSGITHIVLCVPVGFFFVGGFLRWGHARFSFPNPEAKSACADGTALVGVWESKSLPAKKIFFFNFISLWESTKPGCWVWWTPFFFVYIGWCVGACSWVLGVRFVH